MLKCCEEANARNTRKQDYTYINGLLQQHLTLISVNTIFSDQIAHYYEKLPIAKHLLTRYHIFQHYVANIDACKTKAQEYLKTSTKFKPTLSYLLELADPKRSCPKSTPSDNGTKIKRKRNTKTQQYLLDRQRYEREQRQANTLSENEEFKRLHQSSAKQRENDRLLDLVLDSLTPKTIVNRNDNIKPKTIVNHHLKGSNDNAVLPSYRIKMLAILRFVALHNKSVVVDLSVIRLPYIPPKVVARPYDLLDSGEHGIISGLFAHHEVATFDREPEKWLGIELDTPNPMCINVYRSRALIYKRLSLGNHHKYSTIEFLRHNTIRQDISFCQQYQRDALDIAEIAQLARHRRRLK